MQRLRRGVRWQQVQCYLRLLFLCAVSSSASDSHILRVVVAQLFRFPHLSSLSLPQPPPPLCLPLCACVCIACVCVYAIIPSSHAAFCRLLSFAFHLGCLVAVSVSGRYGGNLKSALEASAFVSSTAAGRGDWAGTVPYDEGWAVRAERSSAGNVLISDSSCELAGR